MDGRADGHARPDEDFNFCTARRTCVMSQQRSFTDKCHSTVDDCKQIYFEIAAQDSTNESWDRSRWLVLFVCRALADVNEDNCLCLFVRLRSEELGVCCNGKLITLELRVGERWGAGRCETINC